MKKFPTRSMDEFSHLAELPEVNPVPPFFSGNQNYPRSNCNQRNPQLREVNLFPPFSFWKSKSSEKQLSPKKSRVVFLADGPCVHGQPS